MRAGDLRHRVTIEQPVKGSTGGLGTAITWEPLATVWAAIKPLEGRELLAAQQVQSKITVEIATHYRPDVTSAMRVKHGTAIYEIKSPPINPDLRNRELLLQCARQGA